MNSGLVALQDGVLMEVDVPEQQLQQIAGGAVEQVSQAMSAIEPILLTACRPIANVLSELNKDMSVSEVTVDVGLGVDFGGNFFIAKGTAKTSLSIKIKLTPKN